MSKESLWLEARSLRIASCLMVAVGVYLPLMKTTTGYSWLTVGTAAWFGYGLAAVVALLSLFAEDMPATLSRKIAWVCAISPTAATTSWSRSAASGAGSARHAAPGAWRRRRRTWSTTSFPTCRCASGF